MVITKRPHSQFIVIIFYMVFGFGFCDLYAHVWLGEDLSQVTDIHIMFCYVMLCSWFQPYPIDFIGTYCRVNVALEHCGLSSNFAYRIYASLKKLDSSTVWLLFTWYMTHFILIYHNWQYIGHSNRLNTRATCSNLIATYCYKSSKRLCQHYICRVDATLVGVRY